MKGIEHLDVLNSAGQVLIYNIGNLNIPDAVQLLLQEHHYWWCWIGCRRGESGVSPAE